MARLCGCVGSLENFGRALDLSSRRRPGSSPWPSSRRKPGSILILLQPFEFSRKHVPVFFHSPSWRAGHFSLLAQREVTKRKGTPAVAVAGLLPGDFVRTLRGSLTAHPCAGSERAGIVPAPLRAFPSCPHRGRGDPEEQRSGRPVRRSGRLAALAAEPPHSACHTPSFRRRPESSSSPLASSFDLEARVGR